MARGKQRSLAALIVALSAAIVGAYAILVSGVLAFVFDPR